MVRDVKVTPKGPSTPRGSRTAAAAHLLARFTRDPSVLESRDAVSRVVDAWREQCRDRPGQGAETGSETAAVIAEAVVEAVAGAIWSDTSSDDALEAAGQRWGAEQESGADVVTQLSALRGVLATELRTGRHAVDRAVDQVLIAALIALVTRVERLCRSDPLTGIGNRRAFDEALRSPGDTDAPRSHLLTMVEIDLDGLKQINDRYGHEAGDAAITGLTQAFACALRSTDTMFRIGGDEFVVLLPLTEASQVERLMERVSEMGAPAFTWGAASLAELGGDLVALFGEADADLYRRRRERVQGGSALNEPWNERSRQALHRRTP